MVVVVVVMAVVAAGVGTRELQGTWRTSCSPRRSATRWRRTTCRSRTLPTCVCVCELGVRASACLSSRVTAKISFVSPPPPPPPPPLTPLPPLPLRRLIAFCWRDDNQPNQVANSTRSLTDEFGHYSMGNWFECMAGVTPGAPAWPFHHFTQARSQIDRCARPPARLARPQCFLAFGNRRRRRRRVARVCACVRARVRVPALCVFTLGCA